MNITQSLPAFVETNGEETESVNTTFMFNIQKPAEVSLIFHVGMSHGGIKWFFARELLDHGIDMPAGLHDVMVWPEGDNDIVIQLNGTNDYGDPGSVRCRFRRSAVVEFLMRTYMFVPREDEELCMYDMIDDVINKILDC